MILESSENSTNWCTQYFAAGIFAPLGALPLLEVLTLLTHMNIPFKRLKQGQIPRRGQIFQHGAKYRKDHLQKFYAKIIIKLRDIQLCLVLPKQWQGASRDGAPTREELPAGCQRHGGSFTKGLV